MITQNLFLQVMRCSKAAYLAAKMGSDTQINQGSAFIPENIEDLRNKLALIICPQAINIKSEYSTLTEMRDLTSVEMKKRGTALRNATFISNGVHAEVDCVVNSNKLSVWLFSVNRGEIYENDLYAAAYQYFVMTKCGYRIDNFNVITLNKNYNSSNSLDNLIKVHAVTQKVKTIYEVVEEYIDLLRKTLKKDKPPIVQLGHQCGLPWNCIFKDMCWEQIKPGNIFEFSDLSFPQKFRYFRQGIVEMEDVKSFVKLSESDRIQLTSHLTNQEYLDSQKLRPLFTKINIENYYTLELLWIKSPIPEFPNTSPFKNIPFHFSIRKCSLYKSEIKNKTINSSRLLDTRKEFVVELIKNLSEFPELAIVVWDKEKVKEQFNQYLIFYPEFENFMTSLRRRLVGIEEVFRNKTFYSPVLYGRSDLRAVAKFLNPAFRYSSLEISNLWKAKQAYFKLKDARLKDPRSILSSLAQYSNQNSLVIMETVKFLNQKIK